MLSSQVVGLVAGLAAALLYGVASILQAHAVRRLAAAHTLVGFLRDTVLDVRIAAVVALYLFAFGFHVVAIELTPLYLAQSAIAMSLPVTAVLGQVLLHERLHPWQWLAIVGLTTGLLLLAVGSGDPGDLPASAGFAAGLVAGLAAVGALAWSTRGRGPLIIGTVSGVGYALAAVGVRAVDWPPTLEADVAALVLPLAGVLAFWLYSVALDRGGVAAATGGLIVTQTFLPSLVGVIALGDRVSHPVAVVTGLALAVVGAVALAEHG
jgi:drug/metabolite transporter (DMT)-like permease